MLQESGGSAESGTNRPHMLGSRLLVSALLIPLAIGLLVWDAKFGEPAPLLFVLCVAIALRCGWETLQLLRRPQSEPRFAPVAVCLSFLVTMTWLPHWISSPLVPDLAESFALCVLLLLAARAIGFRAPGGHLQLLGAKIATVAYVGVLLCLTAGMRWMGAEGNGYQQLGSLIVSVKMGDVGAYTLGRLFGRRKMSPHLSPGKTWAGAVGAVLGGIVGALLWLHLVSGWFGFEWDHRRWPFTMAFGAVIAVAGLMGDLCESLIKRDAGVKDSAPLMPGFGGLLDLMDSILYAGPIALLMWRWAAAVF
jgi:phosphatidate cytidylyltransferase